MDEKEIINILLNIKKKDEKNDTNLIQDEDIINYRKCDYCKVLIRKNNWSRHKSSKGHLENIEKGIDTNNKNKFKKFNKRSNILKTESNLLQNIQNVKKGAEQNNNRIFNKNMIESEIHVLENIQNEKKRIDTISSINVYKKIYKKSIRPIIKTNR